MVLKIMGILMDLKVVGGVRGVPAGVLWHRPAF